MKQNKVYQAPQMIFQQMLLEDIVTASGFVYGEEGVANKYGFDILKP